MLKVFKLPVHKVIVIGFIILILGGAIKLFNLLNFSYLKSNPTSIAYDENIVRFERHGFQIGLIPELKPQVNHWSDGDYHSIIVSFERESKVYGAGVRESVFRLISQDKQTDIEFVPEISSESRSSVGKVVIDGIEATLYGIKSYDSQLKDFQNFYATLVKDNVIFQFIGTEEYFNLLLSNFRFIERVLPKKEKVSFIRPDLKDLPHEVKNWVENSSKFDLTDFVNAKEFEGKQYIFVRSRSGDFGGERHIKTTQVVVVENEEVIVRVKLTKPPFTNQKKRTTVSDLIYINATGLPVRVEPSGVDYIYFTSLTGISYLPDIVGQSRSIKLFYPKPNTAVGRTFSVSGAAHTFEATVLYRLVDLQQNILAEGFITAGQLHPDFTGYPAITANGLASYWLYFTFDIIVPQNANTGTELTLTVFWISPEDGKEMDHVFVPLKFN